jgi:hypothetical protein
MRRIKEKIKALAAKRRITTPANTSVTKEREEKCSMKKRGK